MIVSYFKSIIFGFAVVFSNLLNLDFSLAASFEFFSDTLLLKFDYIKIKT